MAHGKGFRLQRKADFQQASFQGRVFSTETRESDIRIKGETTIEPLTQEERDRMVREIHDMNPFYAEGNLHSWKDHQLAKVWWRLKTDPLLSDDDF